MQSLFTRIRSPVVVVLQRFPGSGKDGDWKKGVKKLVNGLTVVPVFTLMNERLVDIQIGLISGRRIVLEVIYGWRTVYEYNASSDVQLFYNEQ